MASNYVPTLSASGWVKSVNEKADFLLAHFFESDAFQTFLYGHNNVSSLQWIIQEYNHDEASLNTKIREVLTRYLNRYFSLAEVDVATQTVDEKIEIKIFCKINDNGKEYSLGQLIVTSGNKVDKVIALNN